jgi:hypothetical protein
MRSFARVPDQFDLPAAFRLIRPNKATRGLTQGEPRTPESSAEAAPRFGHDFSRVPVSSGAGAIQAKLTVNAPGDIYEQEAERTAEQVMRMPEPRLQRACACGGSCSGCQTPATKAAAALGPDQAPPVVYEALSRPGQSLDPSASRCLGDRFGYDFSHVRVHTDTTAAAAARAVSARAFTVGRDIVFAADQYSPATSVGRRLLAHELTHVAQQTAPAEGTARVTQPSAVRLARDKDKTILEGEGKTGATTVDKATEVRRIIIKTLSDPKSQLYPYIKGKLDKLKPDKTSYSIDDPAVFAHDYREHAKKRNIHIDPSVKDEDLVREVGGFYDPAKRAIHLKTRSDYCAAFHETMHSLSSPDALSSNLGGFLMEGLTQYFTDVAFQEQTQDVCHGHKYGDQLKCATKLVGDMHFDVMARLFFKDDANVFTAIATHIGAKDIAALQAMDSATICARLSRSR